MDGMPGFRQNVALILCNSAQEILICERRDFPGAWQFPQGGVDGVETHREALIREVQEEIGLAPEDYEIVETKGPYRYLFDPGARKKNFDGQEQMYFRADLARADVVVRLEADCREFRSLRWIVPVAFRLRWVAPMKREVYRKVFQDFFDVALSD